jgi:hypothetical protein
MNTLRILEQFDGYILLEVISEEGIVYVQKWCSPEEDVLCKITTKRIKAYLNKKINLHDLMFEFNEEVLVYNKKKNEYKAVKISGLPSTYPPSRLAMHEEDIRGFKE